MSEFNPHDLAKTEDFVRKLRYFNDMVQEMRSFLGLEISDLKPCQESERELTAAVIRCQAAQATLAEAEAAVAAARDALARANVDRKAIHGQAEGLVKATIQTVDARPGVRPEYKGSLRDVFAFTQRDIAGGRGVAAQLGYWPGGSTALGMESGGILAPLPGAGASGLPVPFNVQVIGENGSVNHLTWEYLDPSPAIHFEVEGAVGGLGGGKGNTAPTEPHRFALLDTVAGGGYCEYRHAAEESVGYPAREGVLAKYRVRAVAGGLVSDWSEAVTVACTNRAEAGASVGKSRLLDLLFTVRRA